MSFWSLNFQNRNFFLGNKLNIYDLVLLLLLSVSLGTF